MFCIRLLFIILTISALSSFVFADYDYCDVLHKSLLFYEAQRSGRLSSNNRIPWRGNSALSDCTSSGCSDKPDGDGNLSGGYYDAGDGVKFMFPASFTTTTLAWGLIEFQSAIAACGETQNYLNTIRWSTDFLMQCHTSAYEFWGQIGNGGLDHAFWGPPEDMTMARPSYKISTVNPGTELALEAASALAAASIAFQTADPAYSSTLLSHARQLYSLGYNYRGSYSDSIPDASNYYKSYGYNDELVWGSTWLYRATGEVSFLNAAKSDYNTYGLRNMAMGQSFDWDQKSPGVLLNMYKATGDAQYLSDSQQWMNSWYPGNGKTYTPGGLVWQMQWGPLRYAAGSAFLALLVADSRSNSWAKGQINYMLGSNPSQRSYVCGFGNNPPINPHHRAAHGSTTFNINDPVNNLHILTGALVGGPDQTDYYVDSRLDYVSNEVALDYNAAFTGALAGLAKLNGLSTVTVPPTSVPTTPVPTTTTTTAPPTTTTTTTTTPTPTTTTTTTTTPRPTTTTTTTTTPQPTTTTTTAKPAIPISQATVRPTTSSSSTNGVVVPPSTTGPISIQLHSGSSVWWFAVAILNGVDTTTKVEFTDSSVYRSFTPLMATNWGYWTFSPSAPLQLPITLRLTSSSGSVVTLTTIINSITQFAPLPSSLQYAAASALQKRDVREEAAPALMVPHANTLKLKVHQGSSAWWMAVALFDAIEVTASIEAEDASGYTVSLRDGGWGYWLLETKGTPLQFPLTMKSTCVSGTSVDFTITSLAPNTVIDSRAQY